MQTLKTNHNEWRANKVNTIIETRETNTDIHHITRTRKVFRSFSGIYLNQKRKFSLANETGEYKN